MNKLTDFIMTLLTLTFKQPDHPVFYTVTREKAGMVTVTIQVEYPEDDYNAFHSGYMDRRGVQ